MISKIMAISLRPADSGEIGMRLMMISPTIPPMNASDMRSVPPDVPGGRIVAMRIEPNAAWLATSGPLSTSVARTSDNVTATMICHVPDPTHEIIKSPSPTPRLTPTTSSMARRMRSPPVRPNTMMAAMGAKNGRG